jgi:uncharacterized membrane protein
VRAIVRRRFCILFILFVVAGTGWAPPAYAQEEVLEGVITRVVSTATAESPGVVEVLVTAGSLRGETVQVELAVVTSGPGISYGPGDRVLLDSGLDAGGNRTFFIVEYVRRDALLWLFAVFAAVALVVAGWRGLTSLLGLGFSFVVIFLVILPSISAGLDPVLTALTAAVLIAPVTFYIAHGISRKTTVAIIGALLALALTGILAQVFTDVARLTGYAAEETSFLQQIKGGALNIRGLYLAGVIIGTLGVLDDITISQAAIVQQLIAARHTLTGRELFARAMSVGRDHIAALVNTLVLVYAGAAMPLLLLFTESAQPFGQLVNYEIVSQEIIRTLVGSTGLVAAVPLTTLLAIYVLQPDAPPALQDT